jgi:hypothetical protein
MQNEINFDPKFDTLEVQVAETAAAFFYGQLVGKTLGEAKKKGWLTFEQGLALNKFFDEMSEKFFTDQEVDLSGKAIRTALDRLVQKQ